MANFFHLLCFCVLFFYSFSYQTCVYGARELASHHHSTQKKSLMTASPCSASTKGSCTPLGQENQSPTSGEILLQDQSKVRSLNSISSNGFFPDVSGPVGTILPLLKRLDSGAFAVQVSFGTPKRDFTLMFDTGSSWTWIKCLPCPNCGNEPIFDPSTSSTAASCASPPCNFTADYHDNTHVKGYYFRDTLTLSSFGLPDFVFGCGHDISPNFSDVDGVLGTEQGDDSNSLLSQTLGVFQQTFCYCLPSTESSSTGYLSFGAQAILTCLSVPAEITIPLTTNSDSDHYYVKLVGITIGQKRLELYSNADQDSSPRTIIDTGTIISRLPGSVYAELQSSFRELMAAYPPAQPSNLLDTCYNLQGLDINNIVPSIILHFQGFNGYEDLNLDPSSTVWKEDSDSQVCLAFAGNKDPKDLTIIGNQQQLNINIRYDIKGEQLGFGMNGCSN